MNKLTIDLADRSYDILIGRNLLPRLSEWIPGLESFRRAVVVTHPAIRQLYGETVLNGLQKAGLHTQCVEIPEGETHKTLQDAETVFNHLIETQCDRRTLLVALGGGVIGDLAGFVAATFLRGVPFIQVPTTLLSQVDSSVGGKTAVNHPLGKNLIGAFYQPRAVMIDLDSLRSLPADEFRAGMAEIIKYGVIEDPDLFAYLEKNAANIMEQDSECLEHIIAASCAIKAKVVEKDERESNYRMVLNYGHTLGHAVEALTDYSQYKHGEAVAIGMVYAARLSHQLGKCSAEVADRIQALVEKFQLPGAVPAFSSEQYIDTMYRDKKAHDKNIRFVLVRDIGTVEIVDKVSEADIVKALPKG
ncbi:MAG: 3-dehydroquinate synthase [Nitrospinaceae bacterium]|nr:3-dehydroquinate synthase [Nitrospinaceae bacterium]NIR55699.1 3-dehydroquinate synthase [Nitrospinaceae bacterium]NIS86143.1 3-dehydroquinate synthase [Nitrospinaceae bacterium]NIT82987.1 3-dehydroquinate synthase [Nitrospinaceae bacterium]NIU45191.1 3-dehydroquinate synthase [Nitrospinaceae bacterium]